MGLNEANIFTLRIALNWRRQPEFNRYQSILCIHITHRQVMCYVRKIIMYHPRGIIFHLHYNILHLIMQRIRSGMILLRRHVPFKWSLQLLSLLNECAEVIETIEDLQ